MPVVKVNPVQTINVRVNPQSQQVVHGTSSFIGASDAAAEAQRALNTANAALIAANTAISIAQQSYDTANTKLNISGGEITGDLIIDNNLTVSNTIFANIETIDGGYFS